VTKRPKIDFLEILKVLRAHRVDCIVVGGVSGVLHGAPITTFDLDVVHSRSHENVSRAIEALRDLDAFAQGRESGGSGRIGAISNRLDINF